MPTTKFYGLGAHRLPDFDLGDKMSENFKTLKEAVAAVLAVEHEWALAALAYRQLKEGNPELLTDEEVSMKLHDDYIKRVNSLTFNGEPLPTIKLQLILLDFVWSLHMDWSEQRKMLWCQGAL